MVEAGSQLSYALSTKVLTTNKTVIIDGRSIAGISNATGSNSSSSTGSTNASVNSIDTSNDFNLIAANCNTNVCFFCQVSARIETDLLFAIFFHFLIYWRCTQRLFPEIVYECL